jgi:hypothetical protein
LIADQDVAKMDGSGGGALSAEVKIPFGGCIPYIALFLDTLAQIFPNSQNHGCEWAIENPSMTQCRNIIHPNILMFSPNILPKIPILPPLYS